MFSLNADGMQAVFWMSIAAIIIAVLSYSTSYWTNYNAKVAEMVAAGADPIAVTCALQDTYGNNPVCVIIATKAEQKLTEEDVMPE